MAGRVLASLTGRGNWIDLDRASRPGLEHRSGRLKERLINPWGPNHRCIIHHTQIGDFIEPLNPQSVHDRPLLRTTASTPFIHTYNPTQPPYQCIGPGDGSIQSGELNISASCAPSSASTSDKGVPTPSPAASSQVHWRTNMSAGKAAGDCCSSG